MVWIALIFLFIVMVALVSVIRDLQRGMDYLKDRIDGHYGVGGLKGKMDGLKREMDWLEKKTDAIWSDLKRIEESGMTEEELKERRREEKRERDNLKRKMDKILRGGKAKSAPKRSRKKAKKRMEK